MSAEYLHGWWAVRECGNYIAFFSEKKFADTYAQLYAIAAGRRKPPKVVEIHLIDVLPGKPGSIRLCDGSTPPDPGGCL